MFVRNTSLTGDFVSSVIVSLVGFLLPELLLIPPILSLGVSDPSDTLALVSSLITGLGVTRLISATTGMGHDAKISVLMVDDEPPLRKTAEPQQSGR